jgi:hypothetical protein
MRVFEQLPAAENSVVPDCRCGQKMQSAGCKTSPSNTDSQIRIYRCPGCEHEMLLTVWSAEMLT